MADTGPRWAKALVPRSLRPLLGELLRVPERLVAVEERLEELGKGVEQLLSRPEPQQLDPPRPGIRRFEFRRYSQNGEDGILLYLFSMVGTATRTFVEFGCGDGRECNTANLTLTFGWSGLLMDRDPEHVERARAFYRAQGAPVTILCCHVTPQNVNRVLEEQGFRGEIDLLSVDIDGMDYWVWEAIEVVQPRVVVIEYNASFDMWKPLVVPYEEDFDRFEKHPSGFYHGASLEALKKLGDRKGYLLAGCESAGVNAFFVRRDVAGGRIADVRPQDAFVPHYARVEAGSPREQLELVKHLPLLEV